MSVLRDYQKDLLAEVYKYWDLGDRSLMVQLATGAGKTVLFADIAAAFLKRDAPVLIVAHREELLWQAQKKVEKSSGIYAGIIKSGYKPDRNSKLQIASIQSITRRKDLPPAELVIVDEAHHASSQTYKKLLEAYPMAKILGFTATPCRNDGQGFKYLFDRLLCGLPTNKLIESGYLVPYKFYQAGKVINTKNVKSSAGDFRTSELSAAITAQIEPEDIVAEWLLRVKDKRTVVFAVDVANSKAYAEAFKSEGVAAEHLDGETPNDIRREILQRFESGKTQVLCNCGIISEGFDLPGIEAIQLVRPTKSLSLWLQMIGRGLRTEQGKNCALIIDHSTSWKTLGLPDDDQEWSLEPQSLSKENRFFAVTCSKCRHIFKPLDYEIDQGYSVCPNCQEKIKLPPGKFKKKQASLALPGVPGGLSGNTESFELDLTTNTEHIQFIDFFISQRTNLLQQCQLKNPTIKFTWQDAVLTYFLRAMVHQKEVVSLGTFRYLARELGYSTAMAQNLWEHFKNGGYTLQEKRLGHEWSQVLDRVRPASTQCLLRQHGNLVWFNYNVAFVTLKSQPLLNMVKDKVANIEVAFQQVFNRQVSVKLGLKSNMLSETHSNYVQIADFQQPDSKCTSDDFIDW